MCPSTALGQQVYSAPRIAVMGQITHWESLPQEQEDPRLGLNSGDEDKVLLEHLEDGVGAE